MTTKYYHLTDETNLVSIMREGLKPQLGPRSKLFGETTEAIYMFPSLDDVDDALGCPWAEEAWDDDVSLAVIEVSVPEGSRLGLENDADFEVTCLDHIPADCIKLVRIEPAVSDHPSPF